MTRLVGGIVVVEPMAISSREVRVAENDRAVKFEARIKQLYAEGDKPHIIGRRFGIGTYRIRSILGLNNATFAGKTSDQYTRDGWRER